MYKKHNITKNKKRLLDIRGSREGEKAWSISSSFFHRLDSNIPIAVDAYKFFDANTHDSSKKLYNKFPLSFNLVLPLQKKTYKQINTLTDCWERSGLFKYFYLLVSFCSLSLSLLLTIFIKTSLWAQW